MDQARLKKFIAVRHGESEANRLQIFSDHESKYPLTEEGRTQVMNAARELSDVSVDGIISSPVLRARETAEILSENLGLEVIIDDRLREASMGVLNETKIIPMMSRKRRQLGLESWESQLGRMVECVDAREGSYLLVSHALPIRALTCRYLGILKEDLCYGIDIKYASLTMVLCSPPRVLTIGSLHLDRSVKEEFNSG